MIMVLTNSTAIDLVNRLDFTKGFNNYHIQWHLSDVNLTNLQTKDLISPNFVTTVSDGSHSKSFTWNLRIKTVSNLSDTTGENKCSNTKARPYRWFGLILLTPKVITPASFRFTLTSSENIAIFNVPAFAIFGETTPNWGCIYSPEEMDKFKGNNFVLHCWIDIPRVASNFNVSKRDGETSIDDSTIHEKAVEELQAGISELFQEVISGGTGGRGDVTLIITKEKQSNLADNCQKRMKTVREFHCHSSILAARSSVFRRMFANGNWKENSEKGKSTVDIVDIDEKVMQMVLRYIYTSTFPDYRVNYELLSSIVYAADKYDLVQLKQWCISCMINDHYENWKRIDQFKLADRHGFDQLKAVCISQLSTNVLSQGKNEETENFSTADCGDNYEIEIETAMEKKRREMKEIILEVMDC